MDLVQRKKNLEARKADLAQYLAESQKNANTLRAEIGELERLYNLAVNNIDVEAILKAESVLSIGVIKDFPSGDDLSCVEDAIKYMAGTLEITSWNDMKNTTYSTKNYSGWYHQREDHQYGYGPRHGSTVFSIGLKPEYRTAELTQEQRNACIYMLESLKAGKLNQKKAA